MLRVVGVLDHLREGQPWISAILLAGDANMCCAMLPVVVATIKDFVAAFTSALVFLDTEMDALMALEVLWPLEAARAVVPVAVLPLNGRTINRFPLASNGVELVTLDINAAIMRTPEDEL